MDFKCPICGWGLEGGDETGIQIVKPYGEFAYGEEFLYCFHCGEKMPDSLEKLRDDISEFKTEGAYHGAIDAFMQSCEDRLTALIERSA